MIRILLQIAGVLILIPAVTIATLRLENRNADGPSILFPGGQLVSGEMYDGPEPDWSFTDDVPVIELQLENPLASRRIFIMESDGKAYVPSGYMRSFLGRIWKDWAFAADSGDGLAVVRINNVRYERQLRRIKEGPEVAAVAAKMAQKYADGTDDAIAATRKSIELGDTWIFELAPRSQ